MKISNIVNNPISQSNRISNNNQLPIDQPKLKSGLDIGALKNIYSNKELSKIGAVECETCAERTYVDGSDDPGVSFKTPGKISPEASASVVLSHELEHVGNEQNKAESEDREVVSQSVTLHSSLCPECGKAYIAGGVTKTTTQNKKEYKVPDDFTKGLFFDQEL